MPTPHLAAEEEAEWLKIDFVADQSAGHVREELLELVRSPQRPDYMNQSAIFWNLLTRTRDRVLMFCRNRSPVANLVFQVVRGSRLNEDFLNGYLDDSYFPIMNTSALQLSLAPLRICDARDPGVFLRTLFDAYPHFECAVCDWQLEDGEIELVRRMTRDKPIAFLCPEQDQGWQRKKHLKGVLKALGEDDY